MQLRGGRLIKHLECKLEELMSLYASRSENYIYSQKEFADFASVSRETVRRHQASIDAFLDAASISKQVFDRDARVNSLQRRVLKLQTDLANAQSMYEAMRERYVDVIEALLANSIDIQSMILPDNDVDCDIVSKCSEACGINHITIK